MLFCFVFLYSDFEYYHGASHNCRHGIPQVFCLSEDKHSRQLGISHASTPHIIVVAQCKEAKQLTRRKAIMSTASSETGPQILVNGEQQDSVAAVEEQNSSISLHDESLEDNRPTEKETQAKMQSVFQQVRNQIRSQGVKAQKSGIMELVQKIKEKETEILQVSSETEVEDANAEEEKEAEVLVDECKDEKNLSLEVLRVIFEEKLEVSKTALKDEFEVQISLLRKEMQAYTDQALKDMECKMQSCQSKSLQQTYPKKQQESKAAEKKQNPPAATSLASRRGKVLMRAKTIVLPKTCAAIITGPRAKSETLSSWKGQSSRFPLRDHVPSLPENKHYQSRNPVPPARPPLHHCKKLIQAKSKTGK